jgi:acetoin utilization protein AcuB
MYERKDKWSVGQWMTPNPQMIAPDTPVKQAYMTMKIEGIRHLLVMEEHELRGIVSDRDLRRPDISDEPDGWLEEYSLEDGYEVQHLMSDEPKTVRSSDSLEKALKLMIFHKISALPVLNKKNRVIGIVSSQDLLNAFAAVMEEFGDVLRQKGM